VIPYNEDQHYVEREERGEEERRACPEQDKRVRSRSKSSYGVQPGKISFIRDHQNSRHSTTRKSGTRCWLIKQVRVPIEVRYVITRTPRHVCKDMPPGGIASVVM